MHYYTVINQKRTVIKLKQKLRHELKHYINFCDYLSLKQRLKVIATPDKNADLNGKYKITSLYFDNVDDKALLDKINGVNCREKFRLRFYNDNPEFIKLEKKSKLNGLCTKSAVRISQDECTQIIAGNILWMQSKNNPLFTELYAKMRYQQLKPKTLVIYTREAFIFKSGNVRITLDYDIRTGLNCVDMFDFSNPTLKTSNAIILEVKYDEFLPEIISDIIQSKTRQASAFSKYAVCLI